MKVLSCPICGSYDFGTYNNMYKCNNCGAIFKDEEIEKSLEDIKNSLKDYIDETEKEKQEKRISALRNNLFFELKKEYLSSNSIYNFSLEIKKILPNDFFGNFFYIASSNNINDLQKFISNTDFKSQNIFFINTIVEFLLKSPNLLTKQIPTLLNEIIDTCYTRTSEEWKTYYNKFISEMKKIDSGFFDVTLPRDVFIAYSSKDKKTVLKVVEFLEKQDISCFVAFRNLQHGSGSIENYEKDLFTAIDNSKIFLFISSTNSRTKNCDALKVEMQYIMDKDKLNLPSELKRYSYDKIPLRYKKSRVEFIAEDYNGENVIGESISNLFFSKIERVYDIKELGLRIYNLLQENPEEEITIKKEIPRDIKFCGYCGTENPINTKFCIECGKNVFGRTLIEARNLVKAIFKKENEQNQNLSINQKDNDVDLPNKESAKKVDNFIDDSNKKTTITQTKKNDTTKSATEKVDNFIDDSNKKTTITQTEKNNKTKSATEKVSIQNNKECLEIENNSVVKFNGNAKKVIIPEGIEIIKENAFSNANSIKEIYFPKTLKLIENNAFSETNNIEKIYIEDIGKWCNIVFKLPYSNPFCTSHATMMLNNKEVRDLTISNTESIKNYCFLGVNLENVEIGEGVKSLGSDLFSQGLKKIKLPSSINSIGYNIFGNNPSLIIEYNGTLKEWNAIRKDRGWNTINELKYKVVYLKKTTKTTSTDIDKEENIIDLNYKDLKFQAQGKKLISFDNCNNVTSVEIPKNIEIIGKDCFKNKEIKEISKMPKNLSVIEEGAFSYNPKLLDINLSSTNVTEIKDGAYQGDTGLTKVENLPKSLIKIGKKAFYGCTGITSFTFPEGIEVIEDNVLESCTSLTSVTFSKIKKIGAYAFNSTKLKEINFNGTVKDFMSIDISEDSGILESEILIKFSYGGKTENKYIYELYTPKILNPNYEIIDKRIVRYKGHSSIVNIPSYLDVDTIGTNAFKGSFVTEVTINSNIKFIKTGAFLNCKCLVKVNMLNSSVELMEPSTFSGCTNLKECILSPKIKTIPNLCFNNCVSLKNIFIQKNTTTISDSAFYNCTNLVIVENSRVLERVYGNAFYNCSSLTSISLDENVNYVGNKAFAFTPDYFVCYVSPKVDKSKWNKYWNLKTKRTGLFAPKIKTRKMS